MSWRTVLGRKRWEREMDQELRFHIDSQVAEYVRQGMDLEEARARAQREFGAMALAKDECRDARSITIVHDVFQDVRYAVRTFARTPLFSAVVVLTLALGIGGTTAIFSVVEAVMLRPLPYPGADRMVRLVEHSPGIPGGDSPFSRAITQPVRAEDLLELRRHSRSLDFVAAYGSSAEMRFGVDDHTEVAGARLPLDLLTSLGARAMVGRLFDEAESTAMAPVVVLSFETWQRNFGGDKAALGRTVSIEGLTQAGLPRQVFTVIGVMVPEFGFPTAATGFWIPFPPPHLQPVDERAQNLAWVREGTSAQAASNEVADLLGRANRDSGSTFEAVALRDSLIAPVRPTLRLLVLAVGLVLLIACANVANLLLARMTVRAREMVLRTALGAGRWRLVRQLLTESVALAVAGGLVGTLLAMAAIRLMRPLFAGFEGGTGLFRRAMFRQIGVDPLQPAALPPVDHIALDGSVLMFTGAVCLFAAVLFGLAPIVQSFGRSQMEALRAGAASAIPSFGLFRRNTGRTLLLVSQVALAVTLLVGTALVINSYVRLLLVDNGYDTNNAFAFEIRVPPRHFTHQTQARFASEFAERLRVAPGVVSAGYSTSLPGRNAGYTVALHARPGEVLPDDEAGGAYHPMLAQVSSGFMDAMGIPVVSGRGFTAGSSVRQVLINEALARKRFLNDEPIGKQVYLGLGGLGGPGDAAVPWQIVGVVADVREQGPDQPVTARLYVNLDDWVWHEQGGMLFAHYYIVRTGPDRGGVLSAVRTIAHEVDPNAALDNVTPLDDFIATMVARPRTYAWLLTMLGIVALVIAASGIYGMMAYAVSQCTREIGVRMALGARREKVFALVLSRAVAVTGVGVIAGLIGAVSVSGYLRGMVFGLTPLDPATYAAVVLVFAVVGIAASTGPALRATRVEPSIALRAE